MRRFVKLGLRGLTAFLAVTLLVALGWAHDEHDPEFRGVTVKVRTGSFLAEQAASAGKVSGQGSMRFRVLATASELPEAAIKVLTNAHGGFAVDRRERHGEVYFALPGAGILRISSDLKTIDLLDTSPKMKDVNLHNANIWYAPDGTPYLVFAANDAGKVFTTTLSGKLVATLDVPNLNDDFDIPEVNQFYAAGGKFAPTGVAELDGLYYVTTGYSFLDYVLTAQILKMHPFTVAWGDLAFGGRGDAPGQFNTAHAVQVDRDGKSLDIADRAHSKIDHFTRYGQYLSSLHLPNGALPCDLQYCDQYMIVPCLDGPDRSKGGPIYILKNNKIISAIFPKDDLGLQNFKHVHSAALRKIGNKYYIIALAWNPGDFAILEQVTD
jgi:hypothetical protein